jgi:hypothetical protein
MDHWWVNVGLSTATIMRSGLTPDPNDPHRNPTGEHMGYNLNPLYMENTGDWMGDYRVINGPMSPVVDKGYSLESLCTNYPFYTFLCADYDGQPRPQGLEFDLGAYEFSANRVFRAAHN